MNLPLDIPALLKAATDIDEARNTPLAVSVYIDETAPGDVVGHVRSARGCCEFTLVPLVSEPASVFPDDRLRIVESSSLLPYQTHYCLPLHISLL